MKYETFHHTFLKALSSFIPDKRALVAFISNLLQIEKRAATRRLCGEYQFRIDEVLEICSAMGITLESLTRPKEEDEYMPPLISYYPLDHCNEKTTRSFNTYINKYKKACMQKGSSVLMACNILPDIFCFRYQSFIKFFIVKCNYFMNNMSSKNSEGFKYQLHPPYLSMINEYLNTIFSFDKLMIVWDRSIIPSIISDMDYFFQTGYLTAQDRESMKKDLYTLVKEINEICESTIRCEGETEITFAVSATNLSKCHMIIKGDDVKIARDSAYYTTYLHVSDPRVVQSVEQILQSTLRSSVIISHSNERDRLKFIAEQKKIIDSIPELTE